jgi:predicted Zn-dependent peptidase
MQAKLETRWRAALCAAILVGVIRSTSGDEPMGFQLTNGLRVRLVPERERDKVVIILGTRAGILNESKGKPHLAHIVEHATVFDVTNAELAQSTQEWFTEQKINGETLGELMYFDIHVSRQELPTALALQAARLSDMTYTDATLQREIPRALQEVEALMRQPNAMAKFALVPFVQGALYGEANVPFRRLTRQISVDDLRTFHAASFRPDSSILCIIGDFDPAQARKVIEQRFARIPRPTQPVTARPALSPGFQRVTWDVPKRHFFLAWNLPKVEDPDQPALYLASALLQQRLIEQHQAGAISYVPFVNHDLDRILLVGCEVADDDGFPIARKAILGEMARLGQEAGLTNNDLQVLLKSLEPIQMPEAFLQQAALPAGMSRTMFRANLELQRMSQELIVGDLDAYVGRLKKVEPSAARKAVAKWLTADKVFAMRVVPNPGFDKE